MPGCTLPAMSLTRPRWIGSAEKFVYRKTVAGGLSQVGGRPWITEGRAGPTRPNSRSPILGGRTARARGPPDHIATR